MGSLCLLNVYAAIRPRDVRRLVELIHVKENSYNVVIAYRYVRIASIKPPPLSHTCPAVFTIEFYTVLTEFSERDRPLNLFRIYTAIRSRGARSIGVLCYSIHVRKQC